jgi:hypothetical protein
MLINHHHTVSRNIHRTFLTASYSTLTASYCELICEGVFENFTMCRNREQKAISGHQHRMPPLWVSRKTKSMILYRQ